MMIIVKKYCLLFNDYHHFKNHAANWMTKNMSHHVTTARGDVTVHALALGVRQRWAKDVYDYTRICMFVHACLLVVELLSLHNFAHIILQL